MSCNSLSLNNIKWTKKKFILIIISIVYATKLDFIIFVWLCLIYIMFFIRKGRNMGSFEGLVPHPFAKELYIIKRKTLILFCGRGQKTNHFISKPRLTTHVAMYYRAPLKRYFSRAVCATGRDLKSLWNTEDVHQSWVFFQNLS